MSAVLILLAWSIEVAFGYSQKIVSRIGHPVMWIGGFIAAIDQKIDREILTPEQQRFWGAVLVTIVLVAGICTASIISISLSGSLFGFFLQALIASSLLASRSLYSHVSAVALALGAGDLQAGRHNVGLIVGRDVQALDEAGVAGAAIESLAENASDGVIAPLFWGLIFGLPGLVAYKALNTMDSMIGHKSKSYFYVGWAAAKLDDIANWIPARITGFLICLGALSISQCQHALKVMRQDATSHRSPNAGWPEAATAGALNVRISGPRLYADGYNFEPWLNEAGSNATKIHIEMALIIYCRAMVFAGVVLAIVALLTKLNHV